MQAGIFMHELGHALGLHHGGNDDSNWKPNYLSIMNYFFQMGGVPESGASLYTYASQSLNADESHLSNVHALSTDSRHPLQLGKWPSLAIPIDTLLQIVRLPCHD
jgi:hypothetical protein